MPHASLSVEFRQSLKARRGGCEHVFQDLRAEQSALIVIDMQHAFLAADSPLCVAAAQGIVCRINALAAALRRAGGSVIWVRSSFAPDGRSSWSMYFDHFAPGKGGARLRELFFAGSPSHAFWHELDIVNNDRVVDKDRFSPFAPGASDLDIALRGGNIDTLLIAGTLTNICCESTARDAMMRDFRCIMVEDANAAASDQEHLAALETLALVFADVRSSQDLIHTLDPLEAAHSPDAS